jgi:hypothetical protein
MTLEEIVADHAGACPMSANLSNLSTVMPAKAGIQ